MEHVIDLRNKFVIEEGFSENLEVKLSVLDQGKNGNVHLQKVANTFNTSLRNVQMQVQKRKENKEIRIAGGRPPILDEIAKDDLLEELIRLRGLQKSPNSKDFALLVIQFGKQTLLRRGLAGASLTSICRTTLLKIRQELDLRKTLGQTTTTARQPAQQDIRNYISVAVMHSVMVEDLFAISALQLMASIPRMSGGICAPLTIVVCDDSMDSDTIVPHQLKGGSWGGITDEPAWIVFAKTRGGNRRFFEWFTTAVLVPFIAKIRKSHECHGFSSLDSAYVHCDGEQQQQIEVMERPDIQELFLDNYITVGKLPASCSGTTQASDVCPYFKASKARLKNLSNEQWDNEYMRRDVTAIVNTREFNADQRKRLIDGILKVIATSQLTISYTMVREGYKTIGLHPLNLEAIISTRKRKCTAQEMVNIQEAMPALIDIFKRKGEIKEAEYTALNIPVDIEVRGHCLQKHEKDLCHQRAVNLTHKHTVLRFEAVAAKCKTARKRREHPDVPVFDETVSTENGLNSVVLDLAGDPATATEEAMNEVLARSVSSSGRVIRRRIINDA